MTAAVSISIIIAIVMLCFVGWRNRAWHYPTIYANRRKRRALEMGEKKGNQRKKVVVAIKEKKK